MAGQRPALSGPLHVLGHILLVLIGWGIFSGFWWLTLVRQSYDTANLTLLVAGALIVAPLMTLYWVLHNRRIYARKGPRRQAQTIAECYDRDWSGRPVRARFDRLRQSRLVVIRSTAEEKHFMTASDMLGSSLAGWRQADVIRCTPEGRCFVTDMPEPGEPEP